MPVQNRSSLKAGGLDFEQVFIMFSRSEKNEDALQCILTKVKTKAEIIVVKRTEVILMLLFV